MKYKLMLAAAVAAVVGVTGASQAALVLPAVLQSGDTVGGWKISFPSGISLDADSVNGHVNLVLEKFAAFDSLEGLDITFTQVDYGATSSITIADEAITNVSGGPFGGFDFLLNNTLTGNAGAAVFGPGPAFNGSTPPFGKQVDGPSEISLSDGILGDTDTAKWGGLNTQAGGDLVIEANPATSGMKKVLDFKEIPVTAVPLPAAAWTGLSGLLGLGLIAGAKRVRRMA